MKLIVRNFGNKLAWLALLFLIAGPILAAVQPAGSTIQICSTFGTKTITLAANYLPGQDQEKPAHKIHTPCPFCSLRNMAIVSPEIPSFGFSVPVNSLSPKDVLIFPVLKSAGRERPQAPRAPPLSLLS